MWCSVITWLRWFGLHKIWEFAVSGFMGFSVCRMWFGFMAGGGMELVVFIGLGC